MQRVTGIGGVFFKSKDPERLFAWYEKHLGFPRDVASGGALPQNRQIRLFLSPSLTFSPGRSSHTPSGS